MKPLVKRSLPLMGIGNTYDGDDLSAHILSSLPLMGIGNLSYLVASRGRVTFDSLPLMGIGNHQGRHRDRREV